MAEAWRLFLALWPDAASAARWQAWADTLPWPPGARRSSTPHLHLTLHFLGHTDAARVPALVERLPRDVAPIALRLDRLEDWQGIAVLCPSALPPALTDLHEALAQTLHALALPVEVRRYRPHVTLARKAPGLHAPAAPDFAWRAERLVLARSCQGYHMLWDNRP